MYGVLKFRFHLVIIGIQESDRLLYINHVPGVFGKKRKTVILCVAGSRSLLQRPVWVALQGRGQSQCGRPRPRRAGRGQEPIGEADREGG